MYPRRSVGRSVSHSMPFHVLQPNTRAQWATRPATPSRRPSRCWTRPGWYVRHVRSNLFLAFFSPHPILFTNTHTHTYVQGTTKMQPGQWVSLKMTKFPSDSPAALKLVDATAATAAAVGACARSPFGVLLMVTLSSTPLTDRDPPNHKPPVHPSVLHPGRRRDRGGELAGAREPQAGLLRLLGVPRQQPGHQGHVRHRQGRWGGRGGGGALWPPSARGLTS